MEECRPPLSAHYMLLFSHTAHVAVYLPEPLWTFKSRNASYSVDAIFISHDRSRRRAPIAHSPAALYRPQVATSLDASAAGVSSRAYRHRKRLALLTRVVRVARTSAVEVDTCVLMPTDGSDDETGQKRQQGNMPALFSSCCADMLLKQPHRTSLDAAGHYY